MDATCSAPIRFGADTPMNTSAPTMASCSVPVRPSALVCSATQRRLSSRLSRPVCTTPSMSTAITSAGFFCSSSRMMAEPAAPVPHTTIRQSCIFLPTTRSALRSAAITTMAVPCWSSWKTGMSSFSRSRASISKQRGAAMSSRLMPP